MPFLWKLYRGLPTQRRYWGIWFIYAALVFSILDGTILWFILVIVPTLDQATLFATLAYALIGAVAVVFVGMALIIVELLWRHHRLKRTVHNVEAQ